MAFNALALSTITTRPQAASDDIAVGFGTAQNAAIEFDTGQTPDSWLFGVPATSNALIVCEKADMGVNFGHALQVNPTAFFHAADATDLTKWGSLAHDGTDFVLTTGKGTIRLNNDVTIMGTTGCGRINSTDSLYLTNDLQGIVFGAGTDVLLWYTSEQTPHTMMLTTPATSNGFLICEFADRTVDFNYPAQANPTIACKSSDAYHLNQIAGIRHDGTDLNVDTYTGALSITQTASRADGYFTMSGVPIATETFTVGADTYTWVAAAGAPFEITIGGDAATCVDNMVVVINTDDTAGVEALDYGSVCLLRADATGFAGNAITTTEAATNMAVSGATLTGGQDGGGGAFWKEYHLGATSVSPGGSGATEGATNAISWWELDAITEYLYLASDIHDDWDGDSDIIVTVHVALDANETANDLIRASLRADYYTDHENISTAKTQTIAIDHDIVGDNAQMDVHELTFVINWNEGGNVVEAEDLMNLRFWLNDVTTAPVVTAVRFLFANIKYKTKYPQPTVNASDPTSG